VSERHAPVISPDEEEVWMMRVEEIARHLPYPPTPEIAGPVRARLARSGAGRMVRALQGAAVIAVALVLATLLIPDLRSRALDFLQIGAVRFIEPTGTPAATVGTTASAQPWVLSLPGETTLDAARDDVSFPIRLPVYPPDLGAPDRVFVQRGSVDVAVLVWLHPDDPGRVRFSLHMLGTGNFAHKLTAQLEETTVNGAPAGWTTEPHEYLLFIDDSDPVPRAVTAPVLLWAQDGITYRLEGDMTLNEARRIAESLE